MGEVVSMKDDKAITIISLVGLSLLLIAFLLGWLVGHRNTAPNPLWYSQSEINEASKECIEDLQRRVQRLEGQE